MASETDKTQAIVLGTVPINDHSQFVHLYTERFGRMTCRIPLYSKGKRANQLRTMMTPMTVLDLVLKGHPSQEIRQIGEARIVQSPYMLTLSHPDKSAQCLYMAEIIAHTVREEEANPRLWEYFMSSLEILEQCEAGWANFHLVFTCGLISQLGFSVDTGKYVQGCRFDLVEGIFTMNNIVHPYYLNEESSRWFCKLFDTRFDALDQLVLNRAGRSYLLDTLLTFLGQHIPEMGHLKSVDVLKTLFE
jgi:DNA repair protein RecO (recombination protein O)